VLDSGATVSLLILFLFLSVFSANSCEGYHAERDYFSTDYLSSSPHLRGL